MGATSGLLGAGSPPLLWVPAVWGGGSWSPLGSFTALTKPCELSPHFKTSWVVFRLCIHLKVEVRVWLLLVSPQPSVRPHTQLTSFCTNCPPPPHIVALRLPPPTAWEPSPWTDSLKLLGFVVFLHLTFKGIGPLVQQRFMERLPW